MPFIFNLIHMLKISFLIKIFLNNNYNNISLFSLLLQFNFVGRILGPRGMTAKQLEQETGCKIMVRGKGSMRDKKKVRNLSVVCILFPVVWCRLQLM